MMGSINQKDKNKPMEQRMSDSIRKERQLLMISTGSAFVFALMGIGLGVWINSLVIVFDGVYSLVSLALTLISLCAAIYIRKESVAKEIKQVKVIESGVILFKGIAITLMCMLSFISAVEAIIQGGRDVNTGIALGFGVVNLIGCYFTYWVMKSQSNKIDSTLVDAEATQWLMDTVISAAVLGGFMIAKILLMTPFADYAQFSDPMMVVIASLYFIVVPVKMIISAAKQLHHIKKESLVGKLLHV